MPDEMQMDREDEGVSSPDQGNFGEALQQLRAGKRVSRNGWNGPGQYLELQVPSDDSKMTLPYIYIRTVQGHLVPWLASQIDILGTDWIIV